MPVLPPRPARTSGVRVAAVALAVLVALPGCATMIDNVVADAISAPAADVRALGGADPMPGDPHASMTRLAPERPGDRARAERLLDETRRSIARYRDVEDAVADGYESFPAAPPPDLQVIHYVHRKRSEREQKAVDPGEPGALLYERDGRGGLRLLGAMYTAPVDAPLAELDARVPLSVTQWHLHQNICVPRPIWDEEAWGRRLPSGEAAFGPESPTATEAACEQVGGRFLPTVFGWMAHLNVYADDPADVWNAMYGHDGMDHGPTHQGGTDHGSMTHDGR